MRPLTSRRQSGPPALPCSRALRGSGSDHDAPVGSSTATATSAPDLRPALGAGGRARVRRRRHLPLPVLRPRLLTGWRSARPRRRHTPRTRARVGRRTGDHRRLPNGGRHVYVPLAERLDYTSARELVEAIATAYPTMDPGPHQSLRTGCIRVPGAAHAKGGHQALTMSLNIAVDVLHRPSPAAAVAALQHAYRAQIDALRTAQAPLQASEPATDPHSSAARGRALSARLTRIARDGVYDTGRYPHHPRHDKPSSPARPPQAGTSPTSPPASPTDAGPAWQRSTPATPLPSATAPRPRLAQGPTPRHPAN